MKVFRSGSWRLVVGLLIAVASIFTVTIGTVSASSGHHSAACTTTAPCIHYGNQGDVDHGTTRGWLDGQTVKFVYSKNFFCADPPTSGAPGHCEAGANAQTTPRGPIDPLYVVVPLGFTPATSTLQCPKLGYCVDHPHMIDLSRILGSSASSALLPPHSHVVTTNNNGQAEWWQVLVVGVTSQSAWDSIVSGKSFSAVQSCETAGTCTKPIPSNFFLFFAVRNNG